MWLLVVAAGSGYLARCLQSGKRPRLDEQEGCSRSPPQEPAEDKDRFEDDHNVGTDGKSWKRSCCRGGNSDTLEGNVVNLTSFQKGVHELGSSKGWPSWPRSQQKDQQRNLHTVQSEPSELLRHIQQEFEDTEEKHEEDSKDWKAGSEILIDSGEDPYTSNVTVKTSLGDVSWTTTRQDAERLSVESLSDLPNIFDWASMAASQKHLMFGAEPSLTTPRSRRYEYRRARSRSRDSTVPSTPNVKNANPVSFLPSLGSSTRKRKAANIIPNSSGRVAKEVLLYAMGMHVGMTCMLLHHKREIEKLNKQLPSITNNTKHDKPQPEDDSESIASVLTVESKPDEMALLEAELEAELEIMQLNLKSETKPNIEIQSSSEVSMEDCMEKLEDGDVTPSGNQNWAVSPHELDRRLRILLEEQQEKQIKQLEADLKEAERKLHLKDEELRSWKGRVYHMTQASLTSPTEETTNTESPRRTSGRKKWFSEDMEANSRDSSSSSRWKKADTFTSESGSSTWNMLDKSPFSSLVSAMSSCQLTDKDEEENSACSIANALQGLSINKQVPVTRSSVTVSDIVQGAKSRRKNNILQPTGKRATRVCEEEQMVHINPIPLWSSTLRDQTSTLPYGSQVIRTVETKIEERFVHCEDNGGVKKVSRSRNSGGSIFAARHRSQRQRRRWFS